MHLVEAISLADLQDLALFRAIVSENDCVFLRLLKLMEENGALVSPTLELKKRLSTALIGKRKNKMTCQFGG